MALLLESIKIKDGLIYNLFYHQKRVNYTRKSLFNAQDILELSKVINPPSKGVFKCRILYDLTLHKIEYIPYFPKKITSLTIISSSIEYQFKYKNRKIFDILLNKYNKTDDIIIEKDGLLTDTSYSNIAFYDTTQWITPRKPLLYGTYREKLLDDGFLSPQDIQPSMLKAYTKIALINAMIGFKIIKNLNPKDI